MKPSELYLFLSKLYAKEEELRHDDTNGDIEAADLLCQAGDIIKQFTETTTVKLNDHKSNKKVFEYVTPWYASVMKLTDEYTFKSLTLKEAKKR